MEIGYGMQFLVKLKWKSERTLKILGEINLSKEKLKLIKEMIDKGYTVSKAGTTI